MTTILRGLTKGLRTAKGLRAVGEEEVHVLPLEVAVMGTKETFGRIEF